MKEIHLLLTFCLGFLIQINVAIGQCEGYDKYPDGEEAAKQAFSDYKNLMEEGHLDSAYQIWKKLFKHSPAGSELHYKDGVKFYKALMRQAPEGREVVLFQTQLLKLYDRRMKCFGYDNGTYNKILAEKADEMYQMNYDENVTRRTYNYVLETGEKRLSAEWLENYAAFCTYLYGAERLGRKVLQKKQIAINELLDYNIENATEEDKKAAYEKAKMRSNAFFNIYLSELSACEKWVDKFKTQLEASPTDSLKRLLKNTLRSMDCLAAELFAESISLEVPIETTTIDTTDQTDSTEAVTTSSEAETNENITKGSTNQKRYTQLVTEARKAFREQQYKRSIELYDQAITETGRSLLKAQYAYKVAEIYFNKLNDKVQAREYAWIAVNYDKAWGQPHLLIGDMYASSYNECVKTEEVASLDLTLAAVQEWKKAVTINPELSNAYSERIEPYQSYLPKIDCDKPIKKTLEIGCWIGEDVEIEECEE